MRSLRKQQTYKNLYGKEITTINSTIPIIADGQTVAAVEVAKDITNIRKMSDTLLELTESKHEPAAEAGVHLPGSIKRYTFDDIYGENLAFRELISRAKKAARNDASVFIYGETGTGKELLAQSIHHAGSRKDRPFLAQNCAAIPETLLEGILFGTAKGGFTGAVDARDCLSRRAGVPCCWMRSVRCLTICRASCCAFCRKTISAASAERRISRCRPVSLRRSMSRRRS